MNRVAVIVIPLGSRRPLAAETAALPGVLARQPIRLPILVAQEFVGLVAVREALRLGIPFEIASGAVRDVGDQGRGGGAVGELDAATRFLAALYAVEEVS